jgi:hypothetical protein
MIMPMHGILLCRENLDNVHTFACFAEQDGSFVRFDGEYFSVHIRFDMFHEEEVRGREKDVPSAAIIYNII